MCTSYNMAVVSEQVWFDRVQRDGRSGVYSLFGFVRDIDGCVHTYTKGVTLQIAVMYHSKSAIQYILRTLTNQN